MQNLKYDMDVLVSLLQLIYTNTSFQGSIIEEGEEKIINLITFYASKTLDATDNVTKQCNVNYRKMIQINSVKKHRQLG